MKTLNFKIAAIAALLVAFIAFAMHYDHLKEKNQQLKKDKIALEADAKEKERVANLTEQARIDANKKLEAAKDEIKKRDDCIASGDCKRVVRIKSVCPQAAPAGGIEEGFAELAPDTQRNISDFEIKLAEQESKLALCLAYARGVSQDGK